jgi:hypothetical protein
MSEIKLGPGLTLPIEAVTETVAILANRGAGKSSTARVFVEELASAGQPVVVLDIKGDWWGLRSSASGKSDGLPFVIFGGDHADVPLEPTAGRLLAKVLVETRQLAVLDLSVMSKTKARAFTTDFAEEVYRLNRDPLHVVVDEADVLIPQRASADVARLLGAMEDVAKRGRGRGLGMTVISQRAADVSKTVLDLMETLVVLRVTGPKTRKAINDWIDDHASEPEEIRAVISTLSSLETGEAWVWSPGWLRLLLRSKIRPIRTFDSHATPRPGERRVLPQRMAAVDLAALGEQIAATVERAKAEDPRALRARIAELERQLAAAKADQPEPQRVEVPVLTDANLAELREAGGQLTAVRDHLDLAAREMHEQITAALERLGPTVEAIAAAGQSPTPPPAPRPAPTPCRPAPAPQPAPTAGPGDRSLPKAQRAILTALAQHGTRTVTQVALLTGYSHTSGGYRNSLSALRSAGLIEGRGDVVITAAGLDALGAYDPLPVGRALVDWWKAHHLGKAERAILDVLVDRYPAAVPVPEIADATGYSAGSGGFRNSLSRLRSLELASGRGELTVSPTLMGEGAGVP